MLSDGVHDQSNVPAGTGHAVGSAGEGVDVAYGSAGVYNRTDNDFWAVGIAWRFRGGAGR